MDTTTDIPGGHARRAFWIAIALGLLSLVYAFILPLAGLISVTLYFAVAWGIRRHQAGAPLMCAATFLISVAVYVISIFDRLSLVQAYGTAINVVLDLILATLMLVAWQDLRREPSRTGSAWPWLVFPALEAVFFVCLGTYNMPSASMENTILPGDCVLVNRVEARLGRSPQRDEILVFRYPLNHQEMYVKRVVGVPGDRLHLVHKQLYRNGTAVAEPYAIHSSTMEDIFRDNFPATPNVPLQEPAMKMLELVHDNELTVPQGKFFVLGDNRDDSADSRYWGFVDSSEIVGRPWLIYASYDVPNPSDTGAFRSVLNTRWSRVLKWL